MQSTISAGRRPFPATPPPTPSGLHRNIFDFAAIFGVLFLILLTVGMLTWQFWHVNRIYGGVTVGHVAVGGLTRAQALERLTQEGARYPLPALSLTWERQQWPIPPENLQAIPDLLAAVNEAYMVGRGQSMLRRLGQQLVALLGGIAVTPPLTYDGAQLQQAVFAIADEARQPGRPARQLGEVTIPAEPGVLVDVG
ncbi:MAG: peptidoglycan binding domain-containing protein [Caldilineaceae bacterium]